MSNSNSNCDSPAVTTPSSAQKHHSRNTRKKRTRTTTKMNTVIDHNIAFKPKYAKQANPDAPMITRPCTECGKKFWSWKALFGHMRCHPERQWRGINPPPNFQRQPPPEKQIPGFMTQEDHEIAAGLLLLANGDPCSSSHQECSEGDGLNGRFECSSCKKVFGSHQALGGHRASHKNVKGCFANAMTNDEEDEESDEMVMVLEGHKCSICLRVFSSGQALGGHMRCHWDKGEPEPEPSITHHHALITKQGCGLDLNLPAPLQHDSSSPLTLDLRLGL